MAKHKRAAKGRRSSKHSYPTRVGFIFSVFLVLGLLVIARVGELSFMRGPRLRELAFSQQIFSKVVHPPRGSIFLKDREGKLSPLAANLKTKVLTASPREIADPEKYAEILAPLLGLNQDELLAKLSKKESIFEAIKDDVSPDEAQKLSGLKLTGIDLLPTTKRIYPQGELASHLVGFVGEDENGVQGQYGLERSYEINLAGKIGFLSGLKNARGYIVSAADGSLPEEKGKDLVLTVDPAVQFQLERVLISGQEKWRAEKAMGIIMDPKTGQILAMASFPGFDPNHYREVKDLAQFLNPLTSLQFEPGSVIKPITFAAALDLDLITATTTYEDKGRIKIDSWVIENADPTPQGIQTMRQVLEKSLNTGAVFVAEKIGLEKFREYFQRFGFGMKTGIDLPSEVQGNIQNLSSGREVNLATASFGQGVALTPIQIAAAFSAIANNGVLMQPFVVESVLKDGKKIEEHNPREITQIISADTASRLKELMISVVDNGFGRPARVLGYSIAGKTGTAQIPSPSGGYTNETIHTFAGFAPASQPQFVVFIRLDRPQGTSFSSSTTPPMFKQLAEFLFRYYRIPPDRPLNNKQ